MKYTGIIRKMNVDLKENVNYILNFGEEQVDMNKKIGHDLSISYSGEIICLSCGKTTIKSFAQGYCYPCLNSAPETSPCILNPELCEAHLGISRNQAWAEDHCLKDHYVYLAVSSGLKVGVTRATQIPTRWIDQGASFAVKLAKTPNRFLAGAIETELKKSIADKTNWQRMLKNQVDEHIDILSEKERISKLISDSYTKYITEDNDIVSIKYPVLKYPSKIKSINLDKDRNYSGKLCGIKGQYLIFEDEMVINVRKYSGYVLTFEM